MNDGKDADKAILMAAFAKIDVIAFVVALGTVVALMLFGATAILLLKGAEPGYEVGTHLSMLAIYLPGYTVSWPGALVGAGWGALIGALLGFVLATLWNITHIFYITLIVIRSAWVNLLAD